MKKIFNIDNFTYFYDFLPRSIPSHDFSPTQSQYQYRLHRSSGQTQQCSAIETHPYYLDITKLSTVHNHRFLIHPRNKEEKDEKEKEKKKRKRRKASMKFSFVPMARYCFHFHEFSRREFDCWIKSSSSLRVSPFFHSFPFD